MIVTLAAHVAPVAGAEGSRRQGRTPHRKVASGQQPRMSYLFVSGYTALALAFGLVPTLYALYLSVVRDG